MNSNYKIEVKIDIKTTNENQLNEIQGYNDSFSMIINQNDAESIDKIEKAALMVTFPAIRKSVSKHLSNVSLQKAIENKQQNDFIHINDNPYRIDGEIGRFSFCTHSIYDESNKCNYNTAKDFFTSKKGNEYYKTVGFKEISIVEGVTQSSYRKVQKRINRQRYQEEDGTPSRSLQNTVEYEGNKLQNFIEDKTQEILSNNVDLFKKNTNKESDSTDVNLFENNIKTKKSEDINTAIRECEEVLNQKQIERKGKLTDNIIPYEDPEFTVNISDDDVKVKKQKEKRDKSINEKDSNKKTSRKYILDTLIHVEKLGMKYVLTGFGIKNLLNILIAFLINSDEIKNRIQFFTDGHTILNNAILSCFDWHHNIGIILDWFHLSKKCKERLSSGLKGRKIRNEVLRHLMPLLWNGLTDDAIEYLENLDIMLIKDQSHILKLIEYLKRNQNYIPCYSVRKKLGLRNSSNVGEKMNDLIISERQKHNGMSWSKDGSICLAGLTALIKNNESERWFADDYLEFKLAA
jgi:hypothetical protein